MFNPENIPVPNLAVFYAELSEDQKNIVDSYVLNPHHHVTEGDFMMVEERASATNESIVKELELLFRAEDNEEKKEIGKRIADLLVTWSD